MHPSKSIQDTITSASANAASAITVPTAIVVGNIIPLIRSVIIHGGMSH